jgi:hypothetical protein
LTACRTISVGPARNALPLDEAVGFFPATFQMYKPKNVTPMTLSD